MRSNVVAVILVLACLGLGAVIVVQNKKHAEEKQEHLNTITTQSNKVVTLQTSLNDERMVKETLETNLATARLEDSNKQSAITSLTADLNSTKATLEKTQADAKAAAALAETAVAEREKKISELENQNQELDKASSELRGSITNLESQIKTTEKKLAASEGDREVLLKELKRLRAEKEDLEKKFNDLALLRDQVKKLKEELSISRRLDWMRRGIYDIINAKGGERLMHPVSPAPPSTNGALNVEIKQDGSVNVTPPDGTNAPAPK